MRSRTTIARRFSLYLACAFLLSLGFGPALLGANTARPLGEDLIHAPPSFFSQGRLVIPIDFQFEHLDMKIDVSRRQVSLVADIQFYAEEAGYPMFDLVPEPTQVTLNGVELGKGGITTIAPPCKSTEFRMLTKSVTSGSYNTLRIAYQLPQQHVTFTSSGAKIGFFMSDVSKDRSFLEKYAPANFEFDRFRLSIDLEVSGALTPHHLFTNGNQSTLREDTKWSVYYPYYFTSSSPYFHLTTDPVEVRTSEYPGIEKTIPITIYGQNSLLLIQAEKIIIDVLVENELMFGPYAHTGFLAYITESGGGMEYAGATVTTVGALSHELTHSWFARGVMPPNGNSGWIDEAITSWRDAGFPELTSPPSGPMNLAAFSPYRRTTPEDAYTAGAKLVGFLNHKFLERRISLHEVLRNLFLQRRKGFVTSSILEKQLEMALNEDLSEIFDTHVFGKSQTETTTTPPTKRYHPRPYTEAELISLR